MLPKDKRLPRELFKELLERSRYANSTHFNLRFKLGGHSVSTYRAGVSVSKKISKKAVVRNAIRRRTYSALRALVLPDGLFLFVAKAGAEKVRGEVLQKELEDLIRSIR